MKFLIFALITALCMTGQAKEIRIGSKAFTEGYLLGELAAQTLEAHLGVKISRKFGLGNTGIVFEALAKGEIDLYIEYTGTIREAILHDTKLNDDTMKQALEKMGYEVSSSLGFNNTYALAVSREYASAHQLVSISDLKKVDDKIRTAFSHEFISRADGLSGLQKRYNINLSQNRQGLEHSLAYEAISKRQVDLVDVYSTDAKIESLELIVLKDDLHYFPDYKAVVLARADFVRENPEAWRLLRSLENKIDEGLMRRLNAEAEIEKKNFGRIISEYLNLTVNTRVNNDPTVLSRVINRTKEHLLLVGITVFLAVLTGVPLGILATRHRRFGQGMLLRASIVQTIPSLALLCLLIPLFGIGLKPALVALYLYSLLPVLLNTYLGFASIDSQLIETAKAIGLDNRKTLILIELPLAARNIITGIKTSTVITIGTATLAALIGAGGYGAPIISGLAINNTSIILIGAVPAAVMALLAHFSFELLERMMTPRGLK